MRPVGDVFFSPVKKYIQIYSNTRPENFSREVNFVHLNALKVAEIAYIMSLKKLARAGPFNSRP